MLLQPNQWDSCGEGIQKSLLSHDLLSGTVVCNVLGRHRGQRCGSGWGQQFKSESVDAARKEKVSSVFLKRRVAFWPRTPSWPYLVQSLKSSLQASCCSLVVHSAFISSSSSGRCSSDWKHTQQTQDKRNGRDPEWLLTHTLWRKHRVQLPVGWGICPPLPVQSPFSSRLEWPRTRPGHKDSRLSVCDRGSIWEGQDTRCRKQEVFSGGWGRTHKHLPRHPGT